MTVQSDDKGIIEMGLRAFVDLCPMLKDFPSLVNSMEKQLVELAKSGSFRQASRAVKCIHALRKDSNSSSEAMKKLANDLMQRLKWNNKDFEACLASLGKLALLDNEAMEMNEWRKVIDFVIKNIIQDDEVRCCFFSRFLVKREILVLKQKISVLRRKILILRRKILVF